MMRRPRHRAQIVEYRDFSGGVNTSVSADKLAANELAVCRNFLYEPGSRRLKGRGGLLWRRAFPAPIKSLYADAEAGILYVFLTDRTAYEVIGSEARLIGTLTGGEEAACCRFQNKLWLASGGCLQSLTAGGLLEAVPSSPPADLVFERGGRLCVCRTGSDNVYYSAVGDPTRWESDPSDDSAGGWVEIGYGDSGDILSVLPLATDLIILKSNGAVYQIAGDSTPAAWQVSRIATAADPAGRGSAVHLGGSVVFLSRRGLVSLSAAADYGNIAEADLGDRSRSLVVGEQYDTRLFYLRRQGILLIRAHADKKRLTALFPALGAATELTFGMAIAAAAETAATVWHAGGNKLYEWTRAALADDGIPIDYALSLREVRGGSMLLLKSLDLRFNAPSAGTVTVRCGTLSVDVGSNEWTKVLTNHRMKALALTAVSERAFEPLGILAEVAEL